ncbi:MAG: rRNA maturation RNase YbeY [Anaplasmataceae bacterium]|nr:rRNA maturation RNase YbeY [Anaplasmataceae bacterium]
MVNKVQVSGASTPKVKKEVIQAAKKLLQYFSLNQTSLDIFFLNDVEMTRIKKSHLPHKSGPANTLSFSSVEDFPHPDGSKKPLGEIYLNRDLTKGKLEEILPLLVHSFLHLLGYHHRRSRDMITMNRLATKLLSEIKKKSRA